MKDHILFDTTDAGTIADSDKILSGIISTDGSTLITDTLEGGKQGLDVYVINPNLDVNLQAGDGTDITQTGGALDVNLASGSITINEEDIFDEDSAHTSGDKGSHVLAVRQDTLAASVDTDGDYASFKVDALGSLYVTDEAAQALLTTIDGVLDSIKVDTGALVVDIAAIEVEQLAQGVTLDAILADTTTIAGDTTSIDTNLGALTREEDTVHVSGDKGIMGLAVRNDAGTPLAADGDYIPLMTNANGALFVVSDSDDDNALANTALANTATVVGVTATDLVGTDLASRKYAFIANLGNKKIFIGDSGVTTANGFPVSPGSVLEMRAGAAIDIHAIKAAGGSANDTRILELS